MVQQIDGLAPVAEPELVAVGRVEEELELEGLVVLTAQLHASAVQIHEPRGVVLCLVELDQMVHGEGAVRLELERALVRFDGAGRVLQHVAPSFADAAPDAGALLVVGRELGALDEHAHQDVPVRQQRRQLVHALQRLAVALVDLEEAVPRVERAARVVALLVVDAGERREQLLRPTPSMRSTLRAYAVASSSQAWVASARRSSSARDSPSSGSRTKASRTEANAFATSSPRSSQSFADSRRMRTRSASSAAIPKRSSLTAIK